MSDLTVEPFTIDHYRALCGDGPGFVGACLNVATGPGFALIDDGHILAIGGIRVQGIGQAWAMLAPEAKGRTKTVLKTARAVIHDCIVRERLYRVYAEATVDKPAWFKHLGFIHTDKVYVR